MEKAENTSMDSLLLPVDRVEKVTWRDLRGGSFNAELKRLICFAAPMDAVVTSQFMLQILSMVMVGHLGNLSLASAALASSFCNVTGFSLLVGLSCALDTLSGQAYGAKLYRKLSIQTYTAMFCLVLVCLPLSLIWINMETLLVFLGQDPSIAYEAGRYAICLIPGLLAYAILQPLTRYFQNQSLIAPLLITSCITFCIHVPLCWLLVYKSGLGNIGGALALSLSDWLNVIFLGSFMYYSSACSETRAPLSMEIFDGVGEFFKYALPSAAMTCLEWWSYELLILLSGLLSNPQLETSVLSVCLQTTSTIYAIHLAIAAAARNSFGHIFSSDKETIDYVSKMAPLVSIAIILDGLQGVLSGIARGCGWQHIGAYINLGAFYLWGIPIAACLAFWIRLKGVGLWIGIQTGAALQTLLLAIFTSFTNWENQAIEARKRMAVA